MIITTKRGELQMNVIDQIETFGIPETEGEQKQAFRIESKDQAIWATRKIAQKVKEQRQNLEAAQAEIDRINNWMESENGKLDQEIQFFEALLESYFYRLREEDPKLKSLKLPHGTLKLRKQQPKFEYDEDKLLPWVKENLVSALVIKESVSKTTVKDYIKETGEVVPGVEVEVRPEKFSIEVTD